MVHNHLRIWGGPTAYLQRVLALSGNVAELTGLQETQVQVMERLDELFGRSCLQVHLHESGACREAFIPLQPMCDALTLPPPALHLTELQLM